MARQFLIIDVDLREHAECVADHYEQLGYSVRVERKEIGYPYTPALKCVRGQTTVIVEVDTSIPFRRVPDWTGYARSSGRDMRIVVTIPRDAPLTTDDESKLRKAGVGLLLSDGTSIEEAIPAHDLAINVALPELKNLPVRIRKILGPVYEQIKRAQWREGFEDACQVVADHAKKYLKDGLTRGRITLVTESGKRRNLTDKRIDKMTLGSLAIAFGQISNQSLTDAKIAKVLKRINPDRILVTHYKGKAAAETRLRKNVGQHMWSVIDALKELLGIKS